MEKGNKKVIVAIIILFIILITSITLFFVFKNRTIDVSSAEHEIVIEDKVNFYKKSKLENVKIYRQLDIGTRVYVLEKFKGKDGNDWSKVVIDNKIGYILTDRLGSYKVSNDNMALMIDVSKFNKTNNFETAGEFAAFLINHNIDCVYIRAGGRGYGQKGIFYYDDYYKLWADECEFLKIPFGFYFLDEALNSKEIDEEVEWIKDFLENNKYEYAKLPIALDIENHSGKGRADNIWDTRESLVSELIRDLKYQNIETIIYSNANTANEYLSNIDSKFWLAYYPTLNGEIPKYWYPDLEQEAAQNEQLMSKLIAWQFTESGVGSVIPESLDVSLVYRSFIK